MSGNSEYDYEEGDIEPGGLRREGLTDPINHVSLNGDFNRYRPNSDGDNKEFASAGKNGGEYEGKPGWVKFASETGDRDKKRYLLNPKTGETELSEDHYVTNKKVDLNKVRKDIDTTSKNTYKKG